MENKKKYLWLLLLLILMILSCFLFLLPHKQVNKTTIKKHIKQPNTNLDISSKTNFKTTHNKLASEYNDFCYKYGIIGKDNPNYDKLFDLDNSGYVCDETTQTTNTTNQKGNLNLLSFYDNDKSLNKYLKQKETVVAVNDVIETPVIKDVTSEQPKVPVVEPKVIKAPLVVKPQVITTQPVNTITAPTKNKKQIYEENINNIVKFITDTLNSKLPTSYKSITNLKDSLTELIPNLNIKINDLNMSMNSEILNKLDSKVSVDVNGKTKEITIKDIILKQKLLPTYSGNALTPEQLNLFEKYKTSTDLDVKSHVVKKLIDLGIDINNIVEVN